MHIHINRLERSDSVVTQQLIITIVSKLSVIMIVGNKLFNLYSPRREWADPGGTAIPGQPVEKSQQAPASSPSSKNQFNIEVPHWGTYQILS